MTTYYPPSSSNNVKVELEFNGFKSGFKKYYSY